MNNLWQSYECLQIPRKWQVWNAGARCTGSRYQVHWFQVSGSRLQVSDARFHVPGPRQVETKLIQSFNLLFCITPVFIFSTFLLSQCYPLDTWNTSHTKYNKTPEKIHSFFTKCAFKIETILCNDFCIHISCRGVKLPHSIYYL